MSEATAMRQPPRGLVRWLFRLPIGLYRMHLGWLLGGRFLLLRHIGRKSGLPRQTVVEVVRHDPADDVYIIASGFGEHTDWLLNLAHNPAVTIEVGRRKLAVQAQRLTPDEGAAELRDYARRHPRAAQALGRFMGVELDGSEAGFVAAGQVIPIVALRPRS